MDRGAIDVFTQNQRGTDMPSTRKAARTRGFICHFDAVLDREGALASLRLFQRGQDGGKPIRHFVAHFRVREHIELVLADRGKHARGDLGRDQAGRQAFGDMSEQLAGRTFGIRRLRRAIARRPIAPALTDAVRSRISRRTTP